MATTPSASIYLCQHKPVDDLWSSRITHSPRWKMLCTSAVEYNSQTFQKESTSSYRIYKQNPAYLCVSYVWFLRHTGCFFGTFVNQKLRMWRIASKKTNGGWDLEIERQPPSCPGCAGMQVWVWTCGICRPHARAPFWHGSRWSETNFRQDLFPAYFTLGVNFMPRADLDGGAPPPPLIYCISKGAEDIEYCIKNVFEICRIWGIYIYMPQMRHIVYIYTIETKISQNDCIDPSSRQVKVSDSEENLNHMQLKYVPHHANNEAKIGHLNTSLYPKIDEIRCIDIFCVSELGFMNT